MRPDELMVGDIVRLRISHHAVRIESIFKDKHTDGYLCHHTFLHDGEKRYNYSLSMLEPMPLTEEILEKNGFKYFYSMGLSERRFETGNAGVSLYTSKADGKNVGGFHLTLCVDDKDIPAMSITFDMRILYVHELQHTLQLAGINKEITI